MASYLSTPIHLSASSSAEGEGLQFLWRMSLNFEYEFKSDIINVLHFRGNPLLGVHEVWSCHRGLAKPPLSVEDAELASKQMMCTQFYNATNDTSASNVDPQCLSSTFKIFLVPKKVLPINLILIAKIFAKLGVKKFFGCLFLSWNFCQWNIAEAEYFLSLGRNKKSSLKTV